MLGSTLVNGHPLSLPIEDPCTTQPYRTLCAETGAYLGALPQACWWLVYFPLPLCMYVENGPPVSHLVSCVTPCCPPLHSPQCCIFHLRSHDCQWPVPMSDPHIWSLCLNPLLSNQSYI